MINPFQNNWQLHWCLNQWSAVRCNPWSWGCVGRRNRKESQKKIEVDFVKVYFKSKESFVKPFLKFDNFFVSWFQNCGKISVKMNFGFIKMSRLFVLIFLSFQWRVGLKFKEKFDRICEKLLTFCDIKYRTHDTNDSIFFKLDLLFVMIF